MKIGAVPENLLERAAMAWAIAPMPVVDTQFAGILARAITAATRLGLFEAIGVGSATAEEIASRCKTDLPATRKLLNSMVASGYVEVDGSVYRLPRVSRKWLLKDGASSAYGNMVFRHLELRWLEGMEDYVKTGKPLSIHKGMLSTDDWNVYQNGMRSFANTVGPIIAKVTPVPRGARTMLDIGGSHGYYSVALCRRHPQLTSTVLDLPEAVEHAGPLLAKEGMGDRVTHRAGDALTEELGTEAYDLVLLAGVVHHFTDQQNRDLAKRIARALRPGGVMVIHEMIRPTSPTDGGQFGQLLDLFFAVTSESGTWSYQEMADWQRQAGLMPLAPVRYRMLPGIGQQAARKPA